VVDIGCLSDPDETMVLSLADQGMAGDSTQQAMV
jgi:hypothetical protein